MTKIQPKNYSFREEEGGKDQKEPLVQKKRGSVSKLKEAFETGDFSKIREEEKVDEAAKGIISPQTSIVKLKSHQVKSNPPAEKKDLIDEVVERNLLPTKDTLAEDVERHLEDKWGSFEDKVKLFKDKFDSDFEEIDDFLNTFKEVEEKDTRPPTEVIPKEPKDLSKINGTEAKVEDSVKAIPQQTSVVKSKPHQVKPNPPAEKKVLINDVAKRNLLTTKITGIEGLKTQIEKNWGRFKVTLKQVKLFESKFDKAYGKLKEIEKEEDTFKEEEIPAKQTIDDNWEHLQSIVSRWDKGTEIIRKATNYGPITANEIRTKAQADALNEKFKEFADKVAELKKSTDQKLALQKTPIEDEQGAHKSQIDISFEAKKTPRFSSFVDRLPKKIQPQIEKFLQNFFRTGRSNATQQAIGTIFRDIQIQLRAGFTHYVTRDLNAGEKPKPKDQVELIKLAEDFFSTDYAQNGIKHSPTLASTVGTLFLNNIDRIAGVYRKEDKLSPDLWISSPVFLELNKKFVNLLDKKPYDGVAVLEFIKSLPEQRLKELAKIEPPDFSEVDVEILTDQEKFNNIFKEVLESEETFYNNISNLHQYYKNLKKDGIINSKEFEDLTKGLADLLTGSRIFLEVLQNVEKGTYEEKLKALQTAFAPKKIRAYLDAYSIVIPNTKNVLKRLNSLEKKEAGKESIIVFKKTYQSLQPRDFASQIFQRIGKFPLFLKEIEKQVNTGSDAFNNALQNNKAYIDDNLELLNQSIEDVTEFIRKSQIT